MEKSAETFSKKKAYIIGAAGAVFVLLIISAAIYYWDDIKHLQNYGYLGAFLFGFLAGISIPMPLPYLVVTFTLGGVLNPALVGVASGVGAGIGGTLVYLFGRGGRRLFPKLGLFSPQPDQTPSPKVARFLDWAQRRGSVVVFVMSVMLNPVFTPMAITMGALRFRMAKFLLWCTAGNTIKSLIIAYGGYFGLGALLRWLDLL
ncbi:MAG: hypothetical protein E3J67_03100 [Dehalococcoidia bacterium]|nr:MAG: hypothetical protein E3J67_03100 [Dehalococcoidia bacterium]